MRLVVVLLLAASCAPSTPIGSCTFWEDCGPGGACEYDSPQGPNLFACSFSDPSCAGTERRFGEYTAPAYAGKCVGYTPVAGGICDKTTHLCSSGSTCRAGRCINIASISAGGEFATARCDPTATTGDVWAWGLSYEVLGPDVHIPTPVFAKGSYVEAAKNHLCYRVGAASICQGLNTQYQLGDMDPTKQITVLPPYDIMSVAVGHTCGMGGGQTQVMCWGDDSTQQLDGIEGSQGTWIPTAVSHAGANFVKLAAGGTFTCATTTDDKIVCWGGKTNWSADTFDVRGPPNFVKGLGPGAVTSLDAGDVHACAVKGGVVYCWGIDDAGQIDGVPTTAPQPPRAVVLPAVAVAVAAGKAHTCAVTIDGAVWCWGAGGLGQLGSSTTSPMPVRVPLQTVALEPIAAGDDFTCVLLGDALVHCWGAPDVISHQALTDRVPACSYPFPG